MQVLVALVWEVVVDHNVHALHVDAAAKEVRGDQDALVELLEGLEARDALLLLHARVDADAGEVALCQQPVQFVGARHLRDEDHHLVEFQRVEQVVELAVLLGLAQLDVVLLQPVQGELGVVVHVDLHRLGRRPTAPHDEWGGGGEGSRTPRRVSYSRLIGEAGSGLKVAQGVFWWTGAGFDCGAAVMPGQLLHTPSLLYFFWENQPTQGLTPPAALPSV
mmetsp:Transcript_21625/g.37103  ORF Transcript_21625/g.37103 Transcript_21625/m.37103 type:complete len:220 (-) Transcript_21625:1322-1981(-)